MSTPVGANGGLSRVESHWRRDILRVSAGRASDTVDPPCPPPNKTKAEVVDSDLGKGDESGEASEEETFVVVILDDDEGSNDGDRTAEKWRILEEQPASRLARMRDPTRRSSMSDSTQPSATAAIQHPPVQKEVNPKAAKVSKKKSPHRHNAGAVAGSTFEVLGTTQMERPTRSGNSPVTVPAAALNDQHEFLNQSDDRTESGLVQPQPSVVRQSKSAHFSMPTSTPASIESDTNSMVTSDSAPTTMSPSCEPSASPNVTTPPRETLNPQPVDAGFRPCADDDRVKTVETGQGPAESRDSYPSTVNPETRVVCGPAILDDPVVKVNSISPKLVESPKHSADVTMSTVTQKDPMSDNFGPPHLESLEWRDVSELLFIPPPLHYADQVKVTVGCTPPALMALLVAHGENPAAVDSEAVNHSTVSETTPTMDVDTSDSSSTGRESIDDKLTDTTTQAPSTVSMDVEQDNSLERDPDRTAQSTANEPAPIESAEFVMSLDHPLDKSDSGTSARESFEDKFPDNASQTPPAASMEVEQGDSLELHPDCTVQGSTHEFAPAEPAEFMMGLDHPLDQGSAETATDTSSQSPRNAVYVDAVELQSALDTAPSTALSNSDSDPLSTAYPCAESLRFGPETVQNEAQASIRTGDGDDLSAVSLFEPFEVNDVVLASASNLPMHMTTSMQDQELIWAREDKLIENVVRRHNGKPWHGISLIELPPGVSTRDAMFRWYRMSLGLNATAPWTAQEDAKLAALLQREHTGTKWISIAGHMPGRIATGCRDRWVELQKRNKSLTVAVSTVTPQSEIASIDRPVAKSLPSSSTKPLSTLDEPGLGGTRHVKPRSPAVTSTIVESALPRSQAKQSTSTMVETCQVAPRSQLKASTLTIVEPVLSEARQVDSRSQPKPSSSAMVELELGGRRQDAQTNQPKPSTSVLAESVPGEARRVVPTSEPKQSTSKLIEPRFGGACQVSSMSTGEPELSGLRQEFEPTAEPKPSVVKTKTPVESQTPSLPEAVTPASLPQPPLQNAPQSTASKKHLNPLTASVALPMQRIRNPPASRPQELRAPSKRMVAAPALPPPQPSSDPSSGFTCMECEAITGSRIRSTVRIQPWLREYQVVWSNGVTTWEERDAFWGEDGSVTAIFSEFEEKRTGLVGSSECHWTYKPHTNKKGVLQPDGFRTATAKKDDTIGSIARRHGVKEFDLFNQNLFKYSRAHGYSKYKSGRLVAGEGLSSSFVFRRGEVVRLPRYVYKDTEEY